jgi:hypothetical protein
MSDNLLDSLTSLMTPEMVGKAASYLGESEPAVTKGMTGAFAVLLNSLAGRSNDDNLMASVFKLVSNPANDASLLGNIAGMFAPSFASSPMGSLGGQFLNHMFGNNTANLGNSLANYAGVRGPIGGSLLNLAAPLLLSMLAKAVRSGNLNLSSLVGMLTGQKSRFAAALPGPLSNLSSYFAAPVREVRETAYTPPPPPPEPKSSIWRWLLPLLLALIALWLLSRCMGGDKVAEAPVVEAPPVVEPAPVVEAAPEVAPVVELPRANYYFEVDQSALPVAREGSLESVVEYLQANPGAVAVVSGYHDPTGDAAHNEELAKSRAQTVKDALLGFGIAESQIDMVKPVVTTGSGDLAEARRVEVTIRP